MRAGDRETSVERRPYARGPGKSRRRRRAREAPTAGRAGLPGPGEGLERGRRHARRARRRLGRAAGERGLAVHRGTGTWLWRCSARLTLPSSAEHSGPRPRDPTTTRSWSPSRMRRRSAATAGQRSSTVVSGTSSGTRSLARRRICSDSLESSAVSAIAGPAVSPVNTQGCGRATEVRIVRRARLATARSMASSRGRVPRGGTVVADEDVPEHWPCLPGGLTCGQHS